MEQTQKLRVPSQPASFIFQVHLAVLQAFINERTSPDVLSYQTDLVERVQAQIHYQVRTCSTAGAVLGCV